MTLHDKVSTMASEKMRNGVDVAPLMETIEVIKKDQEIARF